MHFRPEMKPVKQAKSGRLAPAANADLSALHSLAKFAANDSGEVKTFTAKDAKKSRKVRQVIPHM